MNERRRRDFSEAHWWKTLSCAQQATGNGLANVGYELAFIRGDADNAVAVFKLDNSVVTVDAEGDADMSPEIIIR